MDSAIAFLGGLGLFLTAIKLLAGLPMKVGDARTRLLIVQATGRPWQTCLAGSIAGAALQSTSAVTMILAGFVSARLIEPVGAMGLIAWANVGSSSLVFLASVKLRPLALLLVGMCGVAFYYARGTGRVFALVLEAGLYLGLMLLGLAIMRDGSGALKEAPVIAQILASSRSSVLIALLIGFVSSLVTQSSSTATILILAAVQTRLVSLGDGVMMALGASAASGLSILILGAATKGRERQLIVFQASVKMLGATALLPLVLADRWNPSLGLERTLHLAGDPGSEISIVFLLCQIVSLGTFYGAKGLITSIVARLAPPVPIEEPSPCQQA